MGRHRKVGRPKGSKNKKGHRAGRIGYAPKNSRFINVPGEGRVLIVEPSVKHARGRPVGGKNKRGHRAGRIGYIPKNSKVVYIPGHGKVVLTGFPARKVGRPKGS